MKEVFIEQVNKALNRYLALDPMIQQKSQVFYGECFLIQLTDIEQQFYLSIDEQGFQLASHFEQQADVTLAGSSMAFFRLQLSGDPEKILSTGDIHFSGDVALGQKFQKFWQSIDIDWEEHLSKITGDVIAHQLFQSARQFKDWFSERLSNDRQNLTEFLQEESKILPTRIEVENFYQAIDELRSDVDRVAAKVQRLVDTKSTE